MFKAHFTPLKIEIKPYVLSKVAQLALCTTRWCDLSVSVSVRQIIESRVHTHLASPGTAWMNSPGALLHLPRPATSLTSTPLYRPPADVVPRDNFTAVILCQQGVLPPLYRLLKQVCSTIQCNIFSCPVHIRWIFTVTRQPVKSVSKHSSRPTWKRNVHLHTRTRTNTRRKKHT